MMKKINKSHLLFSGGLAATLFFSGTGSALADMAFQNGTVPSTHLSIHPVYDLSADQTDDSSVVEANDLQEDLLGGSVAKADLLEQGFSEAQVRKIFKSAPTFK